MTRAVDDTSGRVAQRRRTRRAIVDATMQLLAEGAEPSIGDIAARADVSRRTIYLYFPAIDQLLLDAAVGLANADIDTVLDTVTTDDPKKRLSTLIDELYRTMAGTLPIGRKLIKLTVDLPAPDPDQPRRGYRRIGWLEWAVAPIRERLAESTYEDLVSGLALVIGWEAFIVLLDVRALTPEKARGVTESAAHALVDAALRSG